MGGPSGRTRCLGFRPADPRLARSAIDVKAFPLSARLNAVTHRRRQLREPSVFSTLRCNLHIIFSWRHLELHWRAGANTLLGPYRRRPRRQGHGTASSASATTAGTVHRGYSCHRCRCWRRRTADTIGSSSFGSWKLV